MAKSTGFDALLASVQIEVLYSGVEKERRVRGESKELDCFEQSPNRAS